MRAGRMDKQITIQQVTETADAYGQPVASWSTYRTVWAEVLEQRGREYFNQTEVAQAVTIFRIWHLSGLTRKMRISYDGDYYDIVSIVTIGRDEGQEIVAQANVD